MRRYMHPPFGELLFITIKTWTQFKHPLVDEWIKNCDYIYIYDSESVSHSIVSDSATHGL